MGIEENRNAGQNGVFGSDSSEFQLGSKNKYKRMKSEVTEEEEEDGSFSKENRDTRKYVFACAIFASLNSVLLGYDVGVMSGAILFIQEDLKITDVQQELLVGILSIISLLGSLAGGKTSDAIGRKWTIAFAAFIFQTGAAVMAFAPSYEVLMIGRLFAGIGIGFGVMIAPVYIAEISPSVARGSLTSFPEIFINLGILLGYISNYAFSGLPVHISWRVMLGVGIIPSVFLGFALFVIPESPRWLVMQNRIEEARIVLIKTNDSEKEVEERLAEIQLAAAGMANAENNEAKAIWREILNPSPPVRRMLITGCGIQCFQQITGIDATVYYSPTIFKNAGIKGNTQLLAATVTTTMVHSAYDSVELISDCPTKIEAISSYGPKLLLGCSDGSLKIYAPDSSGSRSPPSDYHSQSLQKEPYSLERNLAGFSKKPLLSLEVLQSRDILLSLSETISFHGLPNLGTIAVITKAKGANVYSWDDRRGFLCFSRQKKVCIFRHDGGRGFVEVKEFGVPDVVKSMAWCGENICIGIRRDYMILNSTTGALTDVFPSGRLAPPLVVPLPSGELLLSKDNIGVFVDQNGKLAHEGRVCWTEAPTVVVIQKAYGIALLSRYVEVRSLRAPYPLIQTIILRNARRLLQSNNAAIVALDYAVYGLFPVPLGAQIVQLTASGEFEEALSLCKLLPPEEASHRAAKEASIHIRCAHHRFDSGDYEDAMEHFVASQVDITYVLSMYPSIVLPKTTMVVDPDKLMDISTDSSYLSRGSSGMSDDMEPSPLSHVLESEESAALESKKMSHNTLMALIKFLQKKRFSIIEKATAEGTEEVVLDAVGDRESNRFMKINKGRGSTPVTSRAREMAAILDTALLQALLLTGQSSVALELLKGLNYCDVKICEEILLKSNHHAALLELYKCNSMHHEALKLLQQLVEESKSNQVQPEVIQKIKPESIVEYLKPLCGTDPMLVLEYSMLVLESCPTQTIELFLNGNIPADLVNSYLKQHAPNMQARYLELMLAMDENGISGNLQNEMVHIYLSEVLDWYADLSAQQKWEEQTYSPTRKKLLSALESISGYSPEALLKRLPADALYEERAVLLGKMNQHELALSLYVHKLHLPEMALSYCDRVYDSLAHQPSSRSSGNIYLTLLQIYLNPKRTTKNFERRIMNLVSPQNKGTPKVGSANTVKSKGGRGAKKIAAIEVADDIRISQSGTDSSRSDGDADADADESGEEGGSTIMLDEVLDVLSRKWDRINGAQALKLLPRETKLQNLLPFMGPLLRKSSEAYRNLSVIKSLRQSDNLQVKEELYEQRKGVVKITSDSVCSLCRKKIGTSVFAVYPNGSTIVHFVCFKDSQSMKAVGRGSPLRKR